MCSLLRFKKTRRKLIANSRGFSSIVGAVFAVLVMMSLISTVFVWSLSQNTLYNNSVTQTRQADLDRSNENVQVSNIAYTAYDNGSVTVSAQINNTGPNSVQFITVWIHVYNSSWTNYNFSNQLPQNPNVQGGTTYALNINLNVSGVKSTGTYTFASWLITTRGNSVALQQTTMTNNIVVSQTTQGIGALMMDFQNFTYYNVTGNQLAGFPNGASGYVVSSGGGNLAFRVILTNLDQQQRAITLFSNSVFFSIFPTTPQQVRGSYWYIANVNGTGYISSAYTSITLPFNVPVAVYFASDHAIVAGQPFAGAPAIFTGTSPVNLALIGQLGGASFGQNIPFVSILILS